MKYNNEETVFENSTKSEETIPNGSNAATDNSEPVAEMETSESEAPTQPEGTGKKWKEVAIGGMSGIAIGAAGILFSGFTLPEGATIPGMINGSDEDHSAEPGIVSQDNPVEVATSVNDDMSFSEAFAAARQEVGANGAFVWHGQVYTTCYAEEWNAMSEAEQTQFSQNAVAAVSGETQHQPEDHSVTTQGGEHHAPEVTDDVDVEVAVLGVEENVVTEDGDIINVGYAEVDGHSALFIDADADGTFDIMATDINDDGYIDVSSEVAEISEAEITVNDFQDASVSDPIDNLYAQTPDYTNDADISSFA